MTRMANHIRQMLTSLLILVAVCQISGNIYTIPGVPTRSYVNLRDINIGAIFPISDYDEEKPCGSFTQSPLIINYIESLVFAIEQINANDWLLPQAKLGFVILDNCMKETTTVSQILSFLPQKEPELCFDRMMRFQEPGPETIPSYDVVGVIGAMRGPSSMAAATLLGPAKIPQISYASTTNTLSDKAKYPYFMRVVPPDRFLIDAIVRFLLKYEWTYISVVYSEGEYGEMTFRILEKKTNEFGICIGTSHIIDGGYNTRKYYDNVVINLRDFARVVILFTFTSDTRKLMAAVKRSGDEEQYIWIGSGDGAKTLSKAGKHWQPTLGGFQFTYFSRELDLDEINGINDWFKSKDPVLEKNPWLKLFWENHFQCEFGNGEHKPSCDPNLILDMDIDSEGFQSVFPVMDSAVTFALGIHALLAEECPGMNGTDARDCIKGPKLLEQLRKLDYPGSIGPVKFDDNGDLLGIYHIEQLVSVDGQLERIKVGLYDNRDGTIMLNYSLITWDNLNYPEMQTTPKPTDSFRPFFKLNLNPSSICSKPCKPDEFLIQKELPCCWECQKCRENEYVTHNGTNCTACPLFWWPDQETFTSCLQILPSYIVLTEPLAIVLLACSVVGMVVTTIVLIMYIRHNKSKIIRSSSRELSFLMLGGIFLGYISVIGLLVPATSISCKVNYFCFCASFTWIYSPLLIRTARIYRIFTNTTSTQGLKFIGRKSQIYISAVLILLQVVMSTILTAVYNPTVQLTMPVRTERYVELSCDFTIPGLASFLSYNLVLVMVCTFLAFKTRKALDNFNETRFISMCVYTTLVLWLAFIPSYFTTNSEYTKTVIMSSVLILSKTAVVCFLYLPKLYVAIHLETGSETEVTSFEFQPRDHTHQTPISKSGVERSQQVPSVSTIFD